MESNSVEVTTLIGCTWSVSNGAPWIEILSPLDNTSSTNVSYRVLANPDALWRTGIVSIAGVDFTVGAVTGGLHVCARDQQRFV